MKEKIKCPKCHLLIDDDSKLCPYCGYEIQEEDLKPKTNKVEVEYKGILSNDKDLNKKKHNFKFESRIMEINRNKNISLFLIGWIGLSILALLLSLPILSMNRYFYYTEGNSIITFSCYFILLGLLLFILRDDLFRIFEYFKNKRTYIYGFSYGFLLIVASYAVNIICSLLSNSSTSNDNQQAFVSAANSYPLLSIIVFAFIGPFVEELTYRLGLFSLLTKSSRMNIVFAYIIEVLIFALIHFNFESNDIINELINLPSYIVSGFILTYTYHKEGIGASYIAHFTNNLLAVILTLLSNIQ